MNRPVHRYAGAAWLRSNLRDRTISPLGEVVADILGFVYAGLYHLPGSTIERPRWDDPRRIDVNVGDSISTYDFNELTNLVLLAHGCSVRLSIRQGGPRSLKLVFSPRLREGGMSQRHPAIEEAIATLGSAVRFEPLCCESSITAYTAQIALLEELNPDQLAGRDLRKWCRGKARQLLPHALETRMVMTGNLRAWRHFLVMRSSRHAEAEIRRLAERVHSVVMPIAPAAFADLRATLVGEFVEWVAP